MQDYKEVYVNTVTASELFDDVCDGARYLLMDILEHHEHTGKPLSIEETLETWDKVFDMVWKKRIGVGKGN